MRLIDADKLIEKLRDFKEWENDDGRPIHTMSEIQRIDRCINFAQAEPTAFDADSRTCNCKHNSNSRDNEPCCRCDSKVSENDDTKNKVTSMEIIVRMIDNKPYYEIKYKKVGEDYCHVGYSSFNIDNVLKWRNECFELVDVKATNADRIRNMSDEELAEFIEQISTDSMETISFGTKEYKEIWERKETALEWLQSEAE